MFVLYKPEVYPETGRTQSSGTHRERTGTGEWVEGRGGPPGSPLPLSPWEARKKPFRDNHLIQD